MKTVSRQQVRLSGVTVGAALALMATLAVSVPSMADLLNCRGKQVVVEARIAETSSRGSRLRDIGLQCPKAADTQGQPAYIQVNIDLTLDANVANKRNFGAPLGNAGPLVVVGRSNITDAVLIVNENTAEGPFATPNYLTGPSGVGQSPQYGLLVGSKTLRWTGVFLPVAGVAGNPDVTTIRITDTQVNLAQPGIPVGAIVKMDSPPGPVFNTESGFEWPGSVIATVPMPLPNPPPGFGLGAVNRPVSIALKINPVVSPDLKINLEVSPPPTDVASAGIATSGTRLALSFTNIPSGAGVWLPPIIYLFRQGSPYANNIQSFDNATTGLPNLSATPAQSPTYQIPYGQTQTPYGAPIYPNPYYYGEQRDRGYDPSAAGVPSDRIVIPWEIPPWQIPGTIPWELRR
jgi:hypothetical protein